MELATEPMTEAQRQDRDKHYKATKWSVTSQNEYEDGWYIVIERETYDQEYMDPYVVGPYSERDAKAEFESDEEITITFTLMTVDAKQERYVAHNAYVTNTPPEGFQIIPPEE